MSTPNRRAGIHLTGERPASRVKILSPTDSYQIPIAWKVCAPYLKDLAHEIDYFLHVLKRRVVCKSQQRHDHVRYGIVVWVLDNLDNGRTVVPRIGKHLFCIQHLGDTKFVALSANFFDTHRLAIIGVGINKMSLGHCQGKGSWSERSAHL